MEQRQADIVCQIRLQLYMHQLTHFLHHNKDQALVFNNVGWTVYDDDLVTEKNGVGWHHTGSTIVSVHISTQNV